MHSVLDFLCMGETCDSRIYHDTSLQSPKVLPYSLPTDTLSICTLILQAMLLPINFPAIVDPISDSAKLGIQNIFAFCYVWSIGGALESHSRDAFDAMVRNTFQGVAIFPQGAGHVYDYYCDPQR